MMNSELEIALVEKIRESHDQAILLRNNARAMVGLALEKAVECGHYLLESQTVVGRGCWTQWFVQHVGHLMCRATAYNWMKLASMPPEELQDAYSKRQAYIKAGIIEPGASRTDPINRDPDGISWISILDRLTVRIESIFDSKPISQWEEDERELFIERTRPVVRKFVEAGGTL